MQQSFLFVSLSTMNIRFKISTGKFFTSLSDSKIKKLDKLQKSVSSINKEYSDISSKWHENSQDFTFSHEEIHSAIRRVEKDENEFRHPFADIDVDRLVEYQSHYSQRFINDNESFVVGLFKAIFGFVVPGVHFNDHYAPYKTGADWTDIYMSEDLKAEVLAELHYRRSTRIFSNILSKFFELRNLITAESPIKTITYKYFNIVFTLKKEVALKTALINEFFNQHLYLGKHEKKYIGYIQAAGRT